VRQLESLPSRLRDAWLHGRWDVFEGQFFPEFDTSVHVCEPSVIPKNTRHFAAFDYGFDMLAALLMAIDAEGNLYVVSEYCEPNLTLSEAAARVADMCSGKFAEYAVASPDLWNRRQDSGKSGFEIMQAVSGMPPMRSADDRRIPGWRVLREYISEKNDTPKLRICRECHELIHSLPALLYDKARAEDASSEPHSVTHAPEALRYAVMSRAQEFVPEESPFKFFGEKSNVSKYYI
jgi:phage terminase large subunit